MAANTATSFPDSPRNGAWGDRPYALIELTGPTSYTQVTNGAAPSGGQAVDNTTFGLSAGMEGIEQVCASNTGTYEVIAIAAPFSPLQPSKNWILRWLTSATGAEVGAGVNLSAETIRLRAFGPY